MAFFKFRHRNPQTSDSSHTPPVAARAENVETMRKRARHRLLGATVLVLIGVVGFPLLFETQPRPVSVDIPIEIPERAKAKPLAVPGPSAASQTGAGRVARSSPAIITETADGTEIPSGADRSEHTVKPIHKPDSKPEPKPERRPEAQQPTPKPATASNVQSARALLDGRSPAQAAAKPAPTEASSRFIVQVGAFADSAKAREVRQKLERAGIKTYIHIAKMADGERTRVRVGPFPTRAEADRAAAKVKGLALPASVLSL